MGVNLRGLGLKMVDVEAEVGEEASVGNTKEGEKREGEKREGGERRRVDG